ncbi:hypothetical protein K456DRAFT_52794 [Colletotrichum gloeosporioides 23]|nr:hypothetical protein K456DRAFT_52794 [Colletotrichum gloeosporioides 23]
MCPLTLSPRQQKKDEERKRAASFNSLSLTLTASCPRLTTHMPHPPTTPPPTNRMRCSWEAFPRSQAKHPNHAQHPASQKTRYAQSLARVDSFGWPTTATAHPPQQVPPWNEPLPPNHPRAGLPPQRPWPRTWDASSPLPTPTITAASSIIQSTKRAFSSNNIHRLAQNF